VFELGTFKNNFRFGAQTFWSLLHHFYTSKSFQKALDDTLIFFEIIQNEQEMKEI
jgi:hypothetical protein